MGGHPPIMTVVMLSSCVFPAIFCAVYGGKMTQMLFSDHVTAALYAIHTHFVAKH